MNADLALRATHSDPVAVNGAFQLNQFIGAATGLSEVGEVAGIKLPVVSQVADDGFP